MEKPTIYTNRGIFSTFCLLTFHSKKAPLKHPEMLIFYFILKKNIALPLCHVMCLPSPDQLPSWWNSRNVEPHTECWKRKHTWKKNHCRGTGQLGRFQPSHLWLGSSVIFLLKITFTWERERQAQNLLHAEQDALTITSKMFLNSLWARPRALFCHWNSM